MEYELILLAAGQGKRMQASKNKVFLRLLGKSVIEHAVQVFAKDDACQHIILVIQEDERADMEKMIRQDRWLKRKDISLVVGGKERQDSVYNGLQALHQASGIVMIHDGARPFIELPIVHDLYDKTVEKKAAILGVPVKDTIKKVVDGVVKETISRDQVWQIQTPQAFCVETIVAAHQLAKKDGFFGTDDASLVEHYGTSVYMVQGSYDNIKLTTPDDMVIGESILAQRRKWRGRR